MKKLVSIVITTVMFAVLFAIAVNATLSSASGQVRIELPTPPPPIIFHDGTQQLFDFSAENNIVYIEVNGDFFNDFVDDITRIFLAAYDEDGRMVARGTEVWQEGFFFRDLRIDIRNTNAAYIRAFIWTREAISPIYDARIDRRPEIPENAIRLVGRVIENRYSFLEFPIAINNQSSEPHSVMIELNETDSVTADYVADNGGNNLISFRVGNTNAADLLGINIIFHVIEDSEQNIDRMVTASVDNARNQFVTFDIADLMSFGNTFDTMVFARPGDVHQATVRVTNATRVIFNGRAVLPESIFGSVSHMFSPFARTIWGEEDVIGTITAVTLAGDNNVDLLIVNSPTIFVVDTVNVNTGRITSRNAMSALNLDTNNRDVAYNITRDGVPISLSDIRPWDVLMVETNPMAINDDGLFNIRVVTNTIQGSITGVSASRFALGSHGVFERAVGFYPEFGWGLGESGVFYIYDGQIVAANFNAWHQYGYIFQAAWNAPVFGGARRPARVQIMLENGTIQLADLAATVSLRNFEQENGNWVNRTMFGDGREQHVGGIWRDPFWPLDDIEDLNGQLIRFGTNANGQINVIELAKAGNAAQARNVFTQLNISSPWDNDFIFNARTNVMIRTFASNVVVDPNALVFFVNDDEDNRDRSSVVRVNTLMDGIELYDVSFYNPIDNRPTIVVVRDFTPIAPVTTLALYDSSVLFNNANQDEIIEVTFWQNGVRTTLRTTPDLATAFAGMNRGWAFRYSVNANNEINDVVWVFNVTRAENAAPVINVNTDWDGGWIGEYWDGFRYYDFDAVRGSTTIRLIVAPVVSVRGSDVTFGAAESDLTGSDWESTIDMAVARNTTNVYRFNGILTPVQRLATTFVDTINQPDRDWAENGAFVRVTPTATSTIDFAAPALGARDWVIVLEVDNVATDILIVTDTIRGSFVSESLN